MATFRMDIDFDIARVIIDELIPYSIEYYLGVRNTEFGVHHKSSKKKKTEIRDGEDDHRSLEKKI